MAEGGMDFDTRLIHAGLPDERLGRAVVPPIFQSAMFELADESDYHSIEYARLSNTPNHNLLAERLAALEEAEAALVTGSGMAAIATTLLTVLKPGDHVLAQDCLYGGTHDLFTTELRELGIEHDFIIGDQPETWAEKLRPTTRALYLESLSNPLLQVPDLEAGVRFAREHGLVSLIDNTFPSPFNYRPAGEGFDLSLHSATKYLNGHSDIVAGAVIGRAELVERVRRRLGHLGGSLDPHACFLLERGLKTLAVRMRHHNESAARIARFLDEHPAVRQVNYPGLEQHPGHERAAALFDGFGGMLSFEPVGGVEVARGFLKRSRLTVNAPSLGGVESLATIPATSSHLGMSPEDRARLGITDSLLRVSVGLESSRELCQDFDQALVG